MGSKRTHRSGGVVVEEADVRVVRVRLRPALLRAVTTDPPHLCTEEKENDTRNKGEACIEITV